MNDPEQANKTMGFTSYPEAYGRLKGLWDLVDTELEAADSGSDTESFLKTMRRLAFQARQVRNHMKAQQ